MRKRTASDELTGLINQLRGIRKQHEKAIAEIETVFRQNGIERWLSESLPPRLMALTSKSATKPVSTGESPAAQLAAALPKLTGKKRGRPAKAATATAAAAPTTGKKRGRKPKAAAAAAATTAAAPTGKRRGRKPGPKPGKKKAAGKVKAPKATKRTRGKFTETGDDLILKFVRKHGSPTTEEIRKHWESQGRRGKAENNLTNLVRNGALVRNRIPGQMRSTYTIP